VKGLDTLLDAWRIAASGSTNARLYLVGDGPKLRSLRAQASRLRLEDSTVLVGSQPHEQLADWYRAADLTVLSSLSEGIPNVLLESLACGTPFVATNVGSTCELDAANGACLVEAGKVEALASAIRERLATPPRASLPDRFSAVSSTAVLARTLERAVERRRRPATNGSVLV